MIPVCLSPDCFGLSLDSGNTVEDHYTAIEHPETALHFSCEIDMPRVSIILIRISFQWQVVAAEVMVIPWHVPVPSNPSRQYPVGFADFISLMSKIEYPLGDGGFTGIDMGYNPYITYFI